MFAATLIVASYFAVPLTLATAVLLRPKIEKRRLAARVIVFSAPGYLGDSEDNGTPERASAYLAAFDVM